MTMANFSVLINPSFLQDTGLTKGMSGPAWPHHILRQMARQLPLDPCHGMAIIRARAFWPRPVWEIAAIVKLLSEDGIFMYVTL